MKSKEEHLKKNAEFRERADHIAQAHTPSSVEAMQKLFAELCNHQAELAAQNEELARIQGQLSLSHAQYFELYDLAPVGYCTIVDGLIVEGNLKLAALLGVGKSDLAKAPFTRFILGEDQDVFYLNHKHFLQTGASLACDLRMVSRDGSVFWARLSASLAPGALEAPNPEDAAEPRIFLMVSDLTEIRRLEAERSVLETRNLKAMELERIGVLAGGVAHDFNNLLTTILGNANLGSLTVGASDRAAPLFKAIETAALRAADLTRQLLTYAGKGSYRMEEVDLDQLIQELAQFSSLSLGPRVTLHYERADRLPFVKGDPAQLSQMISYIIANALEACAGDAGGAVTLRAGAEGLDEAAIESVTWSLTMKPGRYTTLEITDSGTGMTSEVMARAFEPFFTTKFTGRGLGLAAAIGVIAHHGGGVAVRSTTGRGSTMKIFLPAMCDARTLAPGDALGSWRGKGQVLLVDEEEAVRAQGKTLAQHLGFSVLEARSGEEALEAFRLRHEELALVVMDIGMPGLGGRETYLEMCRIDDRVPVLLSAPYQAYDAHTFPEGLAGSLKKPFRAEEFQGLLRRTLEFA